MTGAAKAEILCVTPNPAIDRTLEVSRLRPGAMMRATSSRVAAGGKGVNVARALAALGSRARCMGPLGGTSGRILADLAAGEDLPATWTWCEAETRSCVILVDSAAREATVINEAGPILVAEDWNRICSDVLARTADASAVCVSGSLPPGIAPEALADLCRSLVDSGKAPWVDSSGPALNAALSVRGIRLKINREEAQELLGRRLDGVAACEEAVQHLLARGMATVVLTMGAEGALLASAEGRWRVAAPAVDTASAVASGDSFLAGLVAAWTSGRNLPEALCWGVAAGTANALATGGARFSRSQFDSVLARVQVSPQSH
jgi:1-phosphofructokinase family hexose kinase